MNDIKHGEKVWISLCLFRSGKGKRLPWIQTGNVIDSDINRTEVIHNGYTAAPKDCNSNDYTQSKYVKDFKPLRKPQRGKELIYNAVKRKLFQASTFDGRNLNVWINDGPIAFKVHLNYMIHCYSTHCVSKMDWNILKVFIWFNWEVYFVLGNWKGFVPSRFKPCAPV